MHCSVCGRGTMVLDALLGERYCSTCGLVVEDRDIDSSKDLIVGLDDYRNPILREPSSWLAVNKALGGKLPDLKLKNIATRHLRLPLNKVERSYNSILPFLEIAWNMPVWAGRVPKRAMVHSALLYRKCIRRGITKGRDKLAMAIAVVERSLTDCGIVYNPQESKKWLDIKPRALDGCLIAINGYSQDSKRSRKINIMVRAMYHAEKLGLKQSGVKLARRIAESIARKKRYLHKDPYVLAGAAVYLACLKCGASISRQAVADEVDASERSIRRLEADLQSDRRLARQIANATANGFARI